MHTAEYQANSSAGAQPVQQVSNKTEDKDEDYQIRKAAVVSLLAKDLTEELVGIMQYILHFYTENKEYSPAVEKCEAQTTQLLLKKQCELTEEIGNSAAPQTTPGNVKDGSLHTALLKSELATESKQIDSYLHSKAEDALQAELPFHPPGTSVSAGEQHAKVGV
ncbi:hypothetical protein [Undibacterium crateris]|uniref:hypothetical protein n=1 Tax=Undibacterium crateris TaxID=2528175 RepID=UPI0013895C45|nr:hypothetical protein [Undibacterium crateris]NDI84988.1 hypothetical protein [Undibacterium crateris]